jgi:hypothetical protein
MPGRRLLLISYEFPPAGGITVQRALNFSKYLPGSGVEVHVLSARNPATPILDPSLLRQVPAEVTLHRAFTPELPFALRKRLWEILRGGSAAAKPATGSAPEPSGKARGHLAGWVRGLFFPDPHIVWRRFALRRASAIICRHAIDTVMVTAPPFSTFLIGADLKRRFPHLRLVTDFRDEWLRFLLVDFDFFNSQETRARATRVERQVVELSDLVLAVTRRSLDAIRSSYPGQPDAKFAVVPNGFDPDVMGKVTPKRHGLAGKMIVTHVGTVYKTASPRYYLDAVDSLPPEIRASIVTRFIGRLAETETGVFENRASEIVQLGFLPQDQAVSYLGESDYLLLTMTNDFSLPGKLYEYLASRRPVLALSPGQGEVDLLLRETRGGWCAPHDDPARIRAMLLQAWERTRSGAFEWDTDCAAVESYQRPRLAARLAALFDERIPLHR